MLIKSVKKSALKPKNLPYLTQASYADLTQSLRRSARKIYKYSQKLFRLIEAENEGIITKSEWESFKNKQMELDEKNEKNIFKNTHFEFLKKLNFSDLTFDKKSQVIDRWDITMIYLLNNYEIPWCQPNEDEKNDAENIKEHILLYDLLTRKAIYYKDNNMRFSKSELSIQSSYSAKHSALHYINKFINLYFDGSFKKLKLSQSYGKKKFEKISNPIISVPELLIWMILLNWKPAFTDKAFGKRKSGKLMRKHLDIPVST